jgi:hypothetical protein
MSHKKIVSARASLNASAVTTIRISMTRSTTTALLRRGCVIIGRHHTRNRNTRAIVAGSISIENNLIFSHDHHCWFSSSEVTSPSASAEAAATPYILLHHHRDPSLFPNRQPGSFTYLAYHISSAIDAIVTLISSQEARDNFLALTTTVAPTNIKTSNSNSDDANNTATSMSSSDGSSEEQGGLLLMGAIINSRILNQSDVGFLKPLTLYNELLHPKLQQSSKFNIHEFMAGCGWALSQFHRTKDELLPKLLTNINGVKHSSSRGVVEMENENGGENKNDNKNNDDELLVTKEDDGPSSSSRAEEYNFLEVAANDPDSVEGTFVAMTTPEALVAMQLDGIMRLVAGQMVSSNDARTEDQIQIDKLKEYYNTGGEGKLIDDDTKVMNVALLSARVEEIYPPLNKSSSAEQAILLQKTKSDPNAPLEDESLTVEVDESKAQLVTQLEVLYELQQSSVNDEGKTKTQTSVMVGKFEGCLFGDPNGDELRWKLASYRPAVEFFNTG